MYKNWLDCLLICKFSVWKNNILVHAVIKVIGKKKKNKLHVTAKNKINVFINKLVHVRINQKKWKQPTALINALNKFLYMYDILYIYSQLQAHFEREKYVTYIW